MDSTSCIGIGGGGSISDNEMLVCEILSRLPVTSLMRFKCVCKHFQYLIEEDDYLIHLHYNRSKTRPCLVIIAPRFYLPIPESTGFAFNGIPKPVSGYYAASKEISFLSADIVLGENGNNATAVMVHTVRNTTDDKFKCNQIIHDRTHLGYQKYFQFNYILIPVEGLMCFVCWTLRYTVAFCIYNVSTRDVTIVKNSAVFREIRADRNELGDIKSPSFQLGFDPGTKKHKLIAVFTVRKNKQTPVSDNTAYTVCEALTLGTNTWRRVDDAPLYIFPRNSISVNGSIYWNCTTKLSIREYRGSDSYCDEECPSIVAFDVGSEKFRLIPIPGFMSDQSLVVNDQLAYFCREMVSYSRFSGTAKLWLLDDMHQKESETSGTITTAGSNMNWTEETISLPSDWGSFVVKCHGIAGSDQLILARYEGIEFVSAHSYNRKSKTFSRIEINGIGKVPDLHYAYLFATFVESLFHVNKKKQNQQTTAALQMIP